MSILKKFFMASIKEYYDRNKLFLIFNLFLAFLALYLIHSMVDKPQVISPQKVEIISYQFFLYGILIKFSYFISFYALVSSMWFWWYFYWKAWKLNPVDFCWDFLIISLWFLFSFIILYAILFVDVTLASLNILLAESGGNSIDIVQYLFKSVMQQTQTYSIKYDDPPKELGFSEHSAKENHLILLTKSSKEDPGNVWGKSELARLVGNDDGSVGACGNILGGIEHQQRRFAIIQEMTNNGTGVKEPPQCQTLVDSFKNSMSSFFRSGSQAGLNSLGGFVKFYKMDSICINVDSDKIPRPSQDPKI